MHKRQISQKRLEHILDQVISERSRAEIIFSFVTRVELPPPLVRETLNFLEEEGNYCQAGFVAEHSGHYFRASMNYSMAGSMKKAQSLAKKARRKTKRNTPRPIFKDNRPAYCAKQEGAYYLAAQFYEKKGQFRESARMLMRYSANTSE